MLKTLVKLAIVALLANAVWRVGSAYLVHFRFEDAVMQAVEQGGRKTVDEIKAQIADLTNEYDVPLAPADIDVHRDDVGHTYVDAEYDEPILLLPNYSYPWRFGLHIEDRGVSAPEPGGSRPR
jgi:hypothetical protein